MPSGVPGTLIIRFSRPTAFHRRRASSMRLLRLVREIGRDFEAHVSIAALGLVVDGAQCIGSILNVANGELLVDSFGVEIAALLEFPQRL